MIINPCVPSCIPLNPWGGASKALSLGASPPAPGFAPITQIPPRPQPLISHQSIHPGFAAKRTPVALARPRHVSLVAIGSKLLAEDQPDKRWETGREAPDKVLKLAQLVTGRWLETTGL